MNSMAHMQGRMGEMGNFVQARQPAGKQRRRGLSQGVIQGLNQSLLKRAERTLVNGLDHKYTLDAVNHFSPFPI